MKKALIIFAVVGFIMLMSPLLLLTMISGSQSDRPIQTPTNEDKAQVYYEVSNELGVPWDLVILIDTYVADKTGAKDIEENNPLLTSLDFCKLQVDYYTFVYTPGAWAVDEFGNLYREDGTSEWVHDKTEHINGKSATMSALGLGDTATVTQLWEEMAAYDDNYSDSNKKRETQIFVVPPEEFHNIITAYYGNIFLQQDIEDIMELYESRYLYHLYMESNTALQWVPGNIALPPIVAGNVSRLDIVKIAVQLIDSPYLFGGKSPYPGAPHRALDCSGYVDWVYMQAFGQTVSGNLGGVGVQFQRCTDISESELRIGDLGFYYLPGEVPPEVGSNHIGIYVGKINGKDAFIHCGGPYWGYSGRDSGRVVVSINDSSTVNTANPLGGTFSCEPMNPSKFIFFGRPQFEFIDDRGDAPEE